MGAYLGEHRLIVFMVIIDIQNRFPSIFDINLLLLSSETVVVLLVIDVGSFKLLFNKDTVQRKFRHGIALMMPNSRSRIQASIVQAIISTSCFTGPTLSYLQPYC